MTAALQPVDQQQVPPLEFMLKDFIHPDNRKVVEEEKMQFRALSFRERRRLQRDVNELRRKLKREGYNKLIQKRDRLWKLYCALVSEAAKNKEANHFVELKGKIRACAQAGNRTLDQLSLLYEDYERYKHYKEWLDYERNNRKALIVDARREADIRKAMRKEAKWIESLLKDVFRKTKGCHHIEANGKGKEITRVPKFQKSQTGPDAHYFWLAASKKVMFGWKWLLPYGVNISNLTDDETIENMKAATKRDVTPVWSDQGQLIFRVSRLDSPDALPKLVSWRDTRDFYPENKRDRLPYCIGVAEKRKFKWFDFASDPHILVAGKSQSGKSNLVNGIIATNVSTHTPDELRIVLIDQKGGIEFTHWTEIPHLLWNVAKTVEEVKPILARVVEVMRKRMALLEKAKKKDIASFNASTDDRLPRLMVVIDEMNTFVGLGALTDEIHNLIMLIVSQGRAVGIHMIAATQHPEVRVIPGRIKTNMAVRMSGAMPSMTASQIILDNVDAANLPNLPGRFAVVSGLATLTVQVPRIEDADIDHVVSKAKHDYPETSDELAEMKSAPRLKVWDEATVVRFALDFTGGHLSGQKMHRLLGNESPSERHLSTVCKRVIDQATANGYVVTLGDTQYKLAKNTKGKGHIVSELGGTDSSDGIDVLEKATVSVGTTSEPIDSGEVA